MVTVDKLKSLSNGIDLEHVIQELVEQDIDMDMSFVILQRIVAVYPSLSQSGKALLRRICAKSLLFMSQLIEFIRVLGEKPEARIYKEYLIATLSNEHNAYSCHRCSLWKSEIAEVDRLYFGSKIFNVIGEQVSADEYLRILAAQLEYWFDNYDNWNDVTIAGTLVKIFQFHSIRSLDIIIGDLILKNEANWRVFVAICNAHVGIQQKRVVNRFLLGYMDTLASADNLQTVYNMLRAFNYRLFDFFELHKLKSIFLKYALSASLPIEAKKQLLEVILGKFGTPNMNYDREVCELIVMLVKYMPAYELASFAHDSKFLNTVTMRLSSEVSEVREATMFIAKLFLGDDLKYESSYTINVPDQKLEANSVIDFQKLQTNSITQEVEPKKLILRDISKLSVQEVDADDDSDDEFREIVFLKELVNEFENIDTSKYNHLQLLQKTVTLVRQKKDFVSEVRFYFKPLLNSIAILTNPMEVEGFEEWRINALVSLIVVVPEEIIKVFETLFQGDLSLQQRLSILSALSLASRELRGIDDSYVKKPKFDFPTKRLPWDAAPKQKAIMESSAENNELHISDGQLIWRSRKLDSGSQSNNRQNNFRKHATKFFYPLAQGWLNGIDLGTFDALFKKHYLRTLRIIFSAAYPHHEHDSMALTMEKILMDAEKQGIPIESVESY
ncbi:HDL052Wp [Eremothecium sinecaudum]|uniref:HDL052Wp n=1 Tax=Eremothecium sinecaudum TaxID=45286 RepID=A0A0X8HSH4_9SACH|nr:HDL052Wp [Eremothecium sinecaudum]AMD20692.1 HDL052Wp [Eremothecium sinecaudum]